MDAPAQSPTARQAHPRRPSAFAPATWRFSIRELLLLTTAVATFVALFVTYYKRSLPFSESLLCKEFGKSEHIRAVAAPMARSPVINGGGGGGGNERNSTREFSYLIDIPRSLRANFMWKLEQEAQRMLKQDRPQYSGRMAWGGGNPPGFSYSYQGGQSQGTIHVRKFDVSDERMELVIFIDEHDAR